MEGAAELGEYPRSGTEAIRSGNPAEQILLAARDRGIHFVVLGAQHRALPEFTALGTTTERVMRHAESAVLAVPSGERVVQ